MRVWAICTLLLLTMLAVLEMVHKVGIPTINDSMVWGVLIVSLFFWLISRILKRLQARLQPVIGHSCHLSSFDNLKKRSDLNHTSIVWIHWFCCFGQKVAVLLSVVGLWLATVLQVVMAHQSAVDNQLSQPQQVVATVKILGISDSINNQKLNAQSNLQSTPKASSGYRQLAQIEYAQPLTLTHLKDSNNGSNNGVNFSTQHNGLIELQGMRVLLSAFTNDHKIDLNTLHPNQRVNMRLQLTPLPNKNRVNSGFDVHRWLRSRHINAQAKVLSVLDVDNQPRQPTSTQNVRHQSHQFFLFASLKNKLDNQRFKIRQHFLANWQNKTVAQQQASAVTLSLLTGDRALIDTTSKDLYQLAGISHLLAISGTHVLFLAIITSMLGVGFINKIVPNTYMFVPKWLVRWVLMVVVATLYALFTGFDVPAARTLWMLIGVGVMRLLLVKTSSQQILLMVAVIMAWADPYVLWQAGFWLSFMAVMLLINFEQNTNDGSSANFNYHYKSNGYLNTIWQKGISNYFIRIFINLVKLQLWMFVTLLPLSLLLFGKVSWWGLPVNLLAIGLYGWLIVPINLVAGVLYPVLPNFADTLWALVSHILQMVHEVLTQLSQLQDVNKTVWIYNQLPAGMMVVFALIGLPWLLTKGVLSRLFAIPPIFLAAMMLYNQSATKHGQIALTAITHKDPYLSSQLLQTGEDNWLIVTDYLTADSYYKRHISQDELTQFWQESMGNNGVSHLTGLIIQTPSALLTNAAMQLASSIPVGQLWQAGITDDSGYDKHIMNHTLLNSPLNSQSNQMLLSPCQAGQFWQNQENTVRIRAITGWQNLNVTTTNNATTANKAQALKNCVIEINTNKKITTTTTQPAIWAANNNVIDTATISDGWQDNQTLPLVTRLVIDSATNNQTWQMWQLLCQDEEIATKYLQSGNANNLQQATMMISHSNSALTQDDILRQQSTYLLLNNTVNKYNQVAIRQKLLQHRISER